MENKICTLCNEEKTITEFYQQKDRKRNKGLVSLS